MKKNKTPTNSKGERHGYWEGYYSSGKLCYKGVYNNGKLISCEKYCDFDGKLTISYQV